MDVVGVMVAYLPVVRACTAQSREALSSWSNFKYFVIILIVSTNYIFVHLLDNKVLNFIKITLAQGLVTHKNNVNSKELTTMRS